MTNSPDIRFYDTSSLLIAGEAVFDQKEVFMVSSVTFQELERIKTSGNKDAEVKYNARLLLHLFDKNADSYRVIIHTLKQEKELLKHLNIEMNDDARILSDALYADNHGITAGRVVFVTNDLSLKHLANLAFGNKMIESVGEDTSVKYTGYKDLVVSEDEMALFYQHPDINQFNLMPNQYLIARNEAGEVIDLRVWTGDTHEYPAVGTFESLWFGKIKPYKDDIYQKMLFDSLKRNKITLVKGPAGSGKSIVSLGYLFSMVQKGQLDRVIVFCNTIATLDSAKLGSRIG